MSHITDGVWPVEWHDRVVSTQDEARRRVSNGDTGPVWIVASEQTSGRGRLGRVWHSSVGNMYATALLSPPDGIEPPYLGMSAAMAMLDVVRASGVSDQARLKWPNDVMVGGAKLAGVLVETGRAGGRYWAAVGFGMNVSFAPELGRPTVSLADLSGFSGVGVETVLGFLFEAFGLRMRTHIEHGDRVVSADWRVECSDGLQASDF